MRIWIDIDRVDEVALLLPLVRRFEESEHDILLTARAAPQTLAELRRRDVPFEAVGAIEDSRRDALNNAARRRDLVVDLLSRLATPVDVGVTSSTAASLAAQRLRIPTVALLDDEHHPLATPLSTCGIIHPAAIDASAFRRRGVARRRLQSFDGLLQDLVFADATVSRGGDATVNVLVSGLDVPGDDRSALLRSLASFDVQVVVAEDEQAGVELDGGIVWRRPPTVRPAVVPGLFDDVDAVVSMSGRFVADAAYLGIPVYRVVDRALPRLERYLASLGRVSTIGSAEDLHAEQLRKLPHLATLRADADVAGTVADLIAGRSAQVPAARARRACMVVHSQYPVGEPRGHRQARAAVAAGYAVEVICLSAADMPAHEVADGVRVTRLPVRHVRSAPTWRFFGEYVRFAVRASAAVLASFGRGRLDVVYVHAPPDFLVVCALIPKLLGSRVVLDIHDLSPHMFNARFGNRMLAALGEKALRFIERTACRVADSVITVHEPYREELVRHGVPRDRISIVMNSPASEMVDAARRVAGTKRSGEGFVVAYHGTINHWYGVDLVVKAIAQLRERSHDVRGMLLGEGDALESVEALARDLGVAAEIELSRRYIAHGDALARVATSGCGIIPNRPSELNRFALSSKLLEYVQLGIPVAIARLETLAAHFDKDEVTFFEPGDADALADAIEWILLHPDGARAKADRALRRAEAYSWRISEAHLLEALSTEH